MDDLLKMLGLRSIAQGGTGGSSDELRHVTFMSFDGMETHGVKAVATGDDCADPIAREIFAKPTRESSDQYDYEQAGWATEPNGEADPNALLKVEEDRIVYAAYNASVRSYTITYYDEDGTTVLKTEILSYGATPAYTPTKTGYTFVGWTTEITTVTGDAAYFAQWLVKPDFATLSWAEIAQYAESGQAANVFDIGAEKEFLTSDNVTVTAKIIGFNHDDLSDGSGKAGITLMLNKCFTNQFPATGTNSNSASFGDYNKSGVDWASSNTRNYWNSTSSNMLLTSILPSELRSVIKQVKKKYYSFSDDATMTTDDKLWLISVSELGVSDGKDEGNCYAAYTSGKTIGGTYTELTKLIVETNSTFATRSKYSTYSTALKIVTKSGKFDTTDQSSKSYATVPCLCI